LPANDTDRKKTKNDSDCENFEDDDVIAAVFFVLLCELKNAFITQLHLSSLFTNKRAVLQSARTDQSQFSFPVSGTKLNMLYLALVSGTRFFWHRKSMTD